MVRWIGPFECLIVIALLVVLVGVALISVRLRGSGTTKKCPYCAERIQAEAVVCRYCGRELDKRA